MDNKRVEKTLGSCKEKREISAVAKFLTQGIRNLRSKACGFFICFINNQFGGSHSLEKFLKTNYQN